MSFSCCVRTSTKLCTCFLILCDLLGNIWVVKFYKVLFKALGEDLQSYCPVIGGFQEEVTSYIFMR